MIVQPLELSRFVNALNANTPISVVRFGDGEMYAVTGLRAPTDKNCDGHFYYPDLGAALRNTLIDSRDYIYCIAPKVLFKRGNGITEQSVAWIEKHAPQIAWHDSEVFLNAMLAGELNPLVQALRKRKVMIVGPAHLRASVVLSPPRMFCKRSL